MVWTSLRRLRAASTGFSFRNATLQMAQPRRGDDAFFIKICGGTAYRTLGAKRGSSLYSRRNGDEFTTKRDRWRFLDAVRAAAYAYGRTDLGHSREGAGTAVFGSRANAVRGDFGTS